jgi:predicted phosphoribosyltransferase
MNMQSCRGRLSEGRGARLQSADVERTRNVIHGPMSCITYSTTTQYQPVALHYRLETRVVGVADRHAVGVDDGVAVGVPVPAAVDVPVKAIAASICCN